MEEYILPCGLHIAIYLLNEKKKNLEAAKHFLFLKVVYFFVDRRNKCLLVLAHLGNSVLLFILS